MKLISFLEKNINSISIKKFNQKFQIFLKIKSSIIFNY